METKEIKPKTLITVLAASIREEAEAIAKNIVESAKGKNVEYAELVELFVLNKVKGGNITFSSFAKNAFEEVKNTEKLLTFEVELSSSWRYNKEKNKFECKDENQFTIKSEIDHKAKGFNWDESVIAYGENVHMLFEEFKAALTSKLTALNGEITEVDISEE